MKRLIIMRHGKSSWAEAGLSDFDRPLKQRGVKEAGIVARELTKRNLVPEHIISSPAERAKSTAIIVANKLGFSLHGLEFEPVLYGAGLHDVLKIASAVDNRYHSVMLFGHNPTFTIVANHFGEPIFNLPTCGCIVIELAIDSWLETPNASVSGIEKIIPSALR